MLLRHPTTRRRLVGLLLCTALTAAACGGSSADGGAPAGGADPGTSTGAATTATPGTTGAAAATTDGPWTFTDDRGVTVSLPERPERIVAYVGTAAVLWDLGVRPVGVFGPQRRADGSPEPAAGRIDLDSVESAGETWDGVNLEKLAALQPDLVVSGGISDEDLWVVTEDQLDEVTAIAPLVAVKAYEGSAEEILGGYERLAEALGADLHAPELEAARSAYKAAKERLRAAIAAKPGLRAIATYADAENLYVARPKDFPDLLELQRLDLDLVEPGGKDPYWEMLSWEQAGRYPADLILHDERSYSLQPDELAKFPTWAALPAVKAGQIAPWNAETILSYQGLTEAFDRLAAAIETARPDVG